MPSPPSNMEKIKPAQITRLKRNESVSTHTIDMFCTILNCRVEDIMEHTQDVSPQEENEKK